MRHQIRFDRADLKNSAVDQQLGFVRSESESGETVFNVVGVIGDAWDGLSAGQMVEEVQGIKGDIRMRLNTPGGLVCDALDVHDALMEHSGKVTADIVAQAWSAGTILAAAADEVRIRPAAKYGVHRCWQGLLMVGNAEDLRNGMNQLQADIESLEKLDIEIAKMLADRSGNSIDAVMEWMIGREGVDGTEFVGQEAVDVGFADSLIQTQKATKPTPDEYKAAARARMLRLAQVRIAAV
jgi:ATP-dependent Clp protease, protease subunit